MDTQTVMLLVGAAVVILVGVLVVQTVYGSVSTLPTKLEQAEAVTFTDNDTDYTVAYPYVTTLVTVYNTSATTTQISSTFFTMGKDGTIKVLANGTTRWPNITSGRAYYVYYTHQIPASNTTFTSTTATIWNSISLLAVALLIIAASAILAYFGFGREQE